MPKAITIYDNKQTNSDWTNLGAVMKSVLRGPATARSVNSLMERQPTFVQYRILQYRIYNCTGWHGVKHQVR